ncbi:MAG: rod shape-determining protein MreD [Elusimicrobia bacterium]|nr:rod shape-determining protein MreD [Elusimicrobiota bacterium]
MKFLKLALIFAFVAFAQWLADTRLALWGFSPSLLYLAALAVSVSFSAPAAIVFAFLCGFYVDFLGGSLFGAHALVYTGAAYFTGLLHRRMDLGSLPTQMLFCALMTAAALLALGLVALVFAGYFLWPGFAGFSVIILLTSLLSPVLFLGTAMLHTEEK